MFQSVRWQEIIILKAKGFVRQNMEIIVLEACLCLCLCFCLCLYLVFVRVYTLSSSDSQMEMIIVEVFAGLSLANMVSLVFTHVPDVARVISSNVIAILTFMQQQITNNSKN